MTTTTKSPAVGATNQPETVTVRPMASLEHLAGVAIVIDLWKHPQLQEDLLHYSVSSIGQDRIFRSVRKDRYSRLHQFEEKIGKKLADLSLPEMLRDRLSRLIRPIALQIMNLVNDENAWFETKNPIQNFDSICWTMDGVIDKARTMNELLSDISLGNAVQGYEQACLYCLEDKIAYLWKLLPKRTQEGYCNKYNYDVYKYHLVAYWTCFNTGRLSDLQALIEPFDHRGMYSRTYSVHVNMLTVSVSTGNAVATKYFWKKLSADEQMKHVMSWTFTAIEISMSHHFYQSSNDHIDIFCFFLSKMDGYQQQRVFDIYIGEVLNLLFLSWPWQTYLLSFVNTMWDSVNEKAYIGFLSCMVRSMKLCKNAVRDFQEIWHNTPRKYKKYLFHTIIRGNSVISSILWELFKVNELKTMKLILKSASPTEKLDIIYSTVNADYLFLLMGDDKLSFFDFLIVETELMPGEIDDFKLIIVQKWGHYLCQLWVCRGNWHLLQTFIAWCFAKEEDLRKFKKNVINKHEIYKSLLSSGSEESKTRFLKWCFDSPSEAKRFTSQFEPQDRQRNKLIDLLKCIVCSTCFS